jgi:uroporphyrinogen-III synthase
MKPVIRIVATRPNNRATQLVDALAKLSDGSDPLDPSSSAYQLETIHCPLIQIENYHDSAFQQRLDKLCTSTSLQKFAFDGVIFISGNAIDWAKASLRNDYWQALLSNQLYAIGEQTARLLESEVSEFGDKSNSKAIIHPQQMNSEGLLALPQFKRLQGQNWLIVKGVGGRQTLKQGLQEVGSQVHELSVYRRKQPDLSLQQKIKALHGKDPLWLITSLEALNNLSQVLNKKPQGCRIIVSSDRIAEQANKMNFQVISQAKDASDKSLVDCMQTLINNLPRN